ncbi:MAG: hypothetical protein ACYS8W_18695 [Planctomycetota bacterium]|jgi:hypothetical protein
MQHPVTPSPEPENGTEPQFRFVKYGLNRDSRLAFECCIAAYIFSIPTIPFYFTDIFSYNWDFLSAPTAAYLPILAFPVSGICFLLALISGIVGLLRPSPSFNRALVVAIMPLATPLAVVNLIFSVFVLRAFRKPAPKELETANALGLPVRELYARAYGKRLDRRNTQTKREKKSAGRNERNK